MATKICSSFLSSLHSFRKPFRVNIPTVAVHTDEYAHDSTLM